MNRPLNTMPASIGSALEVFRDAPVAEFEDLTLGRGILVMAPHPDDESLGCGGMIALACSRGIPVIVAVMTDGGGSHPNSIAWPPDRLARLREQEVSDALAELGPPTPPIVFFRYADGKMDRQSSRHEQAVRSLAGIVRHHDIGTIFSTWGEDPHPDHKATFDLATRLSKACPGTTLFAYPIWGLTQPPDISLERPLGPVYRLNISPVRENKQRAIFSHRSQLGQIVTDDPEGFQLRPEVLELFGGRFETFIECPRDDSEWRSRISVSSVDPKHFNALYATMADPWSYAGGEYETHRYDTIISHLPQARYQRGFELGCSIGVLTQRLGSFCDFMLGGDVSPAAVAAARLRTLAAGNVAIELMRAPDELPDGHFDLIVLSEVLYFFNDTDLKRIAAFVCERLEVSGTCILVNYLGDTESPRTGDDAARTFLHLLGDRCEVVSHHRETLFRLDVLRRTRQEARS